MSLRLITHYTPAWVFEWLPVSLARNFVQYASKKTRGEIKQTINDDRQLLVDVSVIYQGDSRTGVQRVVRSLLLQLLMHPPVGYLVCPVYATRHDGYRYAKANFLISPKVEVNKKIESKYVAVQVGDIFLGLDLAAHLLPYHSAQILRWKKLGVKVHVLVYDILPLEHPEWFSAKMTQHFKKWIKWLAIYSDGAVCISEAVRLDLAKYLNKRFSLPYTALPFGRITLGADIGSSVPSQGVPPEAAVILEQMHSTPSILLVGTLEPRKGHDQVLDAFDELQKRNNFNNTCPLPILVIVGRGGWKTEALQQRINQHPNAGKKIIWLQKVSDEWLVQLYTACSAVVVSSRGEGFGLPLIEATWYGKPIICRNLPVFKELKIPDVVYFEGDSPVVLADAIEFQLGRKITENKPQKPSFKWETAAAELMDALMLSHTSAQVQRCVI